MVTDGGHVKVLDFGLARLTVSEGGVPEETLTTLDAIAEARRRIEGNVAPVLALEAMLISAVRRNAR